MRIVVPDDYPSVISGTRHLEKLNELGDVTVYDTKPVDEGELITRIEDAEIVVNIRAYCKFTEDVLGKAKKLKHISVWGVGTDNTDLQAAKRLGITVTNTPGTATESVAEHTLALMLATARRIPQIDASVKDGKWVRGLVTQLHGKTLGVVGTGYIGSQVAKIARGIGMNVVAWTMHPSAEREKKLGVKYVPLDDLLKESDVVTLHLSLTEETRGLIDAEKLSLMKPSATLINTARADIVDKEALTDALMNGRIAGAGLDVFHSEPIDPDNPLLKLDNVTLTPHSAGQTPEVLDRGLEMTVDNVINFLSGKATNVVN
ncbi:hydroxyacid dehydrogenase [Candidatus Bathyarchaeota archaeon]|nr:hydroxyacid dehydrogenase [Candidatus Bathyarchaeota archaeon]